MVNGTSEAPINTNLLSGLKPLKVTAAALYELLVANITSAPPAPLNPGPSETTTSAPSFSANSSLSFEWVIAIVSNPAAFEYCNARCPNPPIPTTAILSYGFGFAHLNPLQTV